jgi:hypothetical protein
VEALANDPVAAAILLAATAASDGEAREIALDAALRARVDAVRAALTSLRERSREAALQALVAALAPRIASSEAPPRARAVLASLAPRELGATWMRQSPSPRVGFRVAAALRTTIACTEDDAWRA